MAVIPSNPDNTNMEVHITLKDINGNPLPFKKVIVQFFPFEQILGGYGSYIKQVNLQTDSNGCIDTIISFYSITNEIDRYRGVVATFEGDDEYNSATVNLTEV